MMPKIKIITDPATKAPIEFRDNAKPRIGYKCPFTNKIVAGRKKYAAHLVLVRKQQYIRRRAKRARAERKSWWKNLHNTVKYPEDLAAILLENQHRLWDLLADKETGIAYKIRKNPDAHKILEISFSKMQYDKKISNTHHAPSKGVTNFRSNKDAPRSYPGWKGRILVAYDSPHSTNFFSSSLVNHALTNINPGSGGGGGRNKDDPDTVSRVDYEVILFADDWPAMNDQHEKNIVFRALST